MNPSTARHAASTGKAAQTPVSRDNSYVLGHHGFIYTGSNINRGVTVRHPAVLLLSVDYTPFNLTVRNGVATPTTAVIVPPLVARRLEARGVPLLSVNIMPSHAAFHVFRAMQQPGALQLDRYAFNHLDADLEALHRGSATIHQAESVFEQVVTEAVRQLPPAPEPDPKALELIRMLDANPDLSVEDLARACGYSHQVMSRLFTSAVGMSVRDYHNWLKQRRVFDLLYTRRSLTQVAYLAGFADSPQLSRAFQRWYGQSPSFSRDPKSVRVFIHGGTNDRSASPELAQRSD